MIDELEAILRSVLDGADRGDAMARVRRLEPLPSGPAWVRELVYVARHYAARDREVDEALTALARTATARFPCPACQQSVLVEPAWSGESASDEICPSCGIQFGYDDGPPSSRSSTYERWREKWQANGQRPVHRT